MKREKYRQPTKEKNSCHRAKGSSRGEGSRKEKELAEACGEVYARGTVETGESVEEWKKQRQGE